MISSLALFAAVALDQCEFFPLIPGSVFTYEEKIGKQIYAISQKVGQPETTKSGKQVITMETDSGTGEPELIRYLVTPDTVSLYNEFVQKKTEVARTEEGATTPTEPVAAAGPQEVRHVQIYPVLKATKSKESWSYVGKTELLGEATSLNLLGNSKYLGVRNVLGQKREVLQVELKMVVGAGSGPAILSESVSLYAKGLGLYELKETNRIGTRKAERIRKLLSFVPAETTAGQP